MSNGWPIVALGEVLRKSEAWVDLDPNREYAQVTVRLWGKGVALRGVVIGSQIASSRQLAVRPNQFILSRIDARNGALGLVPPELDGAVVSNDFPAFDLDASRILPAYLGWMSKTENFVHLCRQASEGTTNRVRLQEGRFLAMEIPLPPLDEQRRIVVRIEGLAGRIEQARGLRREAMAEGEAEWTSIMSAMRIVALQGRYPIQRIGDVADVTTGGTPSRDNPSFWGGDIPWIKTGELLDGDIDRAEEHLTPQGVQNSSAKVFPVDTILVALYGQGQTRGRTGRLIVPTATNQACCAILPNRTALSPRFIQYWLRSLYRDMREVSRDGAQPNWNGGMIKNIQIALLPLGEQERAVAALDRMRARLDALKHLQAETAAELEALLPSVLDRAFRGEL
jgi:type I restriction enzyme S subunit